MVKKRSICRLRSHTILDSEAKRSRNRSDPEIFLSRCPTTHAHLEVSMNDNIYWTVTGYPKKTATCLTDHNLISAQSTKIAQRQLISKFVSQLGVWLKQFQIFLKHSICRLRSHTILDSEAKRSRNRSDTRKSASLHCRDLKLSKVEQSSPTLEQKWTILLKKAAGLLWNFLPVILCSPNFAVS